MESTESGGSSTSSSLLVSDLTNLQELVKKLEGYLGDQRFPTRMCKNLTSEILSSIDRSICLIKCEASDPPFKMINKKRNSTQKFFQSPSESLTAKTGGSSFEAWDWNSMASFPSTSVHGLASVNNMFSSPSTPENRFLVAEGPMDDGYSWSKYGQNDICGAKYPSPSVIDEDEMLVLRLGTRIEGCNNKPTLDYSPDHGTGLLSEQPDRLATTSPGIHQISYMPCLSPKRETSFIGTMSFRTYWSDNEDLDDDGCS